MFKKMKLCIVLFVLLVLLANPSSRVLMSAAASKSYSAKDSSVFTSSTGNDAGEIFFKYKKSLPKYVKKAKRPDEFQDPELDLTEPKSERVEVDENGFLKFDPSKIPRFGINIEDDADKKEKEEKEDKSDMFDWKNRVSIGIDNEKTTPWPLERIEELGVNFISDIDDAIGNKATSRKGDFFTIGNECATDKINRHGYYRFYPTFVEHFRKLPGLGMIEIGIDVDKSMCLWMNYFPTAFIYGFDMDESRKSARSKIFKLDQSKMNEIVKIKAKLLHPIFLIVDDGSHHPEHQVRSFDYLFREILLPGGVYVIEDIETSYWNGYGIYGHIFMYGYRHKFSAIEMFKALADEVNHEFLSDKARMRQDKFIADRVSRSTMSMISTITFAQNLIIITKHSEENLALYGNREYPYEHCLG